MRSSAKWFENAACYRETGSPCHSTASSMFCFGASLPYERFHSFVTKDIDLLPSLVDAYRNLAGLPECWPVIRELLCTVYLSPCEQGRVKLVSRRLCLQAERSCRFLIKHSLWPSELSNCSDSSIYSDVCTVYEVSWKFFSNSTKSSCVNPLVMTKVKQNWYLPYCGFNCTNSWLKSDEHIHLTRFMIVVIPMIFVFSIISLAILFTGGHHNNAVIKPLLWNIVCQLDVEVCWLVPLFPSARKLIVCNEDVLFYLQYLYCTRSEALAKKLCSRMNSYSHLVAWVEADGISGVCFMGYTNPVFLLWFVHVPLSLILLLCFCLLFGGLITRHRSLLKFNRRLNGDGPQYKFSFPLSKLWILLVSHSALLVASWFLQLNDVFSLPTRQHAFLDYILCQLRNNLADETCDLHGAPDIRLLQLHMFLLFVPALINFWVCVNEFVSFRNQLARYLLFCSS
ncbi:unnamed protein product [Soboliphyme baturini]|uniref:FZ domain-containing protein n=1 Tax=Soboliphyme baturini TaxID=241478 RepID=A0A183IBB8_9BILA|nr:unnamed protein product [Soboliphyme baturini]